MTTMPDTSGFLPLKDAAHWAGVSSKTLMRWMQQGLPFFQSGPRTKLLLRTCHIEAFLIRRERKPENLDSLVEETLKELKG